MAGIYAADGSINVTVVDGSSIVEAYASDGSWNVLVSDGSNGPVRDPSGALRVTLTTDPAAQRYASDGSIHVSETKLHNPLWVTAVSGSLSGGAGVAPAAPLMSWASTSSDSTPDFTIDLPSGVGDGTDAQAGDVLHIQYSDDAWVTPQEYVSYTFLSGDITADTITESGITPVADGSYVFRGRLERAAGNSAWSSDVAVTISTAVAYAGPGDIVSSAYAWGGLRAYNAAYAAPGTNPSIDIVDSAGANPTTINILTNGFADWAAIASFIAAHGTPYVKKVYDQTGNGRHWTQATVANMPILVAGLVGYVFNFAQASNQFWQTGNIFATTQAEPFTFSFVAQNTGTASGFASDDSGLFTADFAMFGQPNKTSTWTGSGNLLVAASDNTYHAISTVYNGASPNSLIDVDGTQTTFSATVTLGGAIYIGVDVSNSVKMEGTATEFGIWTIGFTATQASDMSTNKHSAWGF